jgi:hypothetical protein
MEVFLILLSYSPRNIFASIHTNLGYCFSTFSTVKIWYHTAAYFSSTIVPCTQCKAANNTQLSNQAKEAYFKRIKMYIYCPFTKWVVTKKIKLKYPSREGCKGGGAKGVGPRCHLPAAFVVLASFPSPSPCSCSRSCSRSRPLVRFVLAVLASSRYLAPLIHPTSRGL